MKSLNSLIVSFVKLLPQPLVYIFAKKYIAGTKLEDGIKVVKELNSKGIVATMDVLGEAISTRKEAEAAKNECLEVLDAINKNNLDSNISIKPTQFGLLIDEDFCYENVKQVVERAKSYKNFVRIDMEDSATTDAIIRLYKRLHNDYSNVGIVVQAYLMRTQKDVEELNQLGTNYRLCKGIYVEPAEIAYKDKNKIRENYLEILQKMLENGNYVGIATHDDYLVDGAYKMISERKLERNKLEFQMLYGVKENLRDKINSDRYKIRIYVPFGIHWYAYSIRRLQENPEVAWYIFKSLFTFN
ncbi:MAG: proline dehydrogenase [Ignavibacteriales bacterium]